MKFCVFTIVKNEHEYLKEWIEYHKKLGINQIFIFDDMNSISSHDICKKYSIVTNKNILDIFYPKLRKIIEIERPTKKNVQTMFMRNCIEYIKQNYDFDWCFYIDVDEFLTLENENDNLESVFSQFLDYDVVSLQWKNFNASGHVFKPEGSVIDNYTTTCQSFGIELASKLAFNLNRWNISTIKTTHHIVKNAKWCKTNFSTNLKKFVYDKIYIRHYITKSFEEFCKKILIRGQFFNSKKLEHFFDCNKDITKDNENVKRILSTYQTTKQ